MTLHERFQAVMNFRPFDRLPVIEWAVWWDKTIERWHQEGLPVATTDRYDICRHFGLDMVFQAWYRVISPAMPRELWEACVPLKSVEDYERIRPWLYPKDVVDPRQLEDWARLRDNGEAVLWFTLEGFFWFPRMLLGIEPHLYAFYDKPDLMHRINADLADRNADIVEEVCAVCSPDFMTFAEDMSYNHGPMLSKELFDEFLLPYYGRLVPRLKERGVIPMIDSDGDVTVLAYWLEEAGLEGILPLERQAGVDIARLRREHPRMKFIGHFDKMTMNKGEAAMRAEFKRLLPTAIKGGFLISCDHQTPPGVSYQDFQLYLRLFREYAEKAGRQSRLRG